MNLAFVVLLNVLIASDADERDSVWKHQDRLGKYQEAWRSLNKSRNVWYYLVSSTQLMSGAASDNRGTVQTNFTCFSSQMDDLSEGAQVRLRRRKYLLTARGDVYNIEDKVTTDSAFNYTTRNAVKIIHTLGGDSYVNPVIFSDGDMCDLFNIQDQENKDEPSSAAATAAGSSVTYPTWANETRLGTYQHADAVANDAGIYYLQKATFRRRPEFWNNDSVCVSRKYTNLGGTYMTEFSYRNSSLQNITVNKTTILVKTYNYTFDNAIGYQLEDCSFVNDTVIFTSNGSCTLMSVASQNNGNGCELWVSEEQLTKGTVPRCCYFLYDLLCNNEDIYYQYNETQCSDRAKVVQGSSSASSR